MKNRVYFRSINYISDRDDFCLQKLKYKLYADFNSYRFLNKQGTDVVFNSILKQNDQEILSSEFRIKAVSTIKQLASGSLLVDVKKTDPNLVNQLCSQHDCFELENFYHLAIRGHCSDEQYENYLVTYNCIGWALGASILVDPLDLGITLKTSKSKIASNMLKLLQKFNAKKVEDLGNNLKIFTSDEFEELQREELDNEEPYNAIPNNTIALYFANHPQTNKLSLSHMARFITTMNGEDIGAWTSKAGFYPLYSHPHVDDMKPLYGEVLYYAVWDNE